MSMNMAFNLHQLSSDTKKNSAFDPDQAPSLLTSMMTSMPMHNSVHTFSHQFQNHLMGPAIHHHHNADDIFRLTGACGDLSHDPFEPVPLEGKSIETDASASNFFSLSNALDRALDAAAETCSFDNNPAEALDPLKIFEMLPSKVFDPVTIQADEATSTSASLNDPFPDPRNGLKRSPPSHPTPASLPMPKRRRISTDGGPRFRSYQEDQWVEQFDVLVKFKEQHGHCLVPHTYLENQVLSRWVKRQRYQYKLNLAGKTSTMTNARIKKVEEIGFVWDSHACAWDKRFQEMKEYRNKHGDCNVPSDFPENKELATWIKCQRRQYKLYWAGNKTSSMTIQRIRALNEIGFIWQVRELLPLPTEYLRLSKTDGPGFYQE